MINRVTIDNPILSLFTRYKKLIIGLIGIQLIPGIIFICTMLGIIIHQVVNDDSLWHPYKSNIISGFKSGVNDGDKDRSSSSSKYISGYLSSTPWYQYKEETTNIENSIIYIKETHLAMLSEQERIGKRAQMKLEDVKSPLELKLEKRFKNGLDFYADYVAQRIKREMYASNEEYTKALKKEAWKVGYEHGYAEARRFDKWIALRAGL